MKVISFYWEGERWQTRQRITGVDSYDKNNKRVGLVDLPLVSSYVNNLYRGVKKHSDREFEFICFTNEKLNLDKDIIVRQFPIVTDKGVLPRIYMFSEESGLWGHQVLCFDLDVVIVGSLEALMKYKGLFCARSKFKPGEEYKLDGDIMSFRAGPEAEARFWLPFINNIDRAVRMTQGRERYWVRHVAGDIADRWDKVAPGAVVSYKRHVMKNGIPQGASVVSCHGYPRPHQINMLREYWDGKGTENMG